MSLHIEIEQVGDVAVLRCMGRIVQPEALRHLESTVTGWSQLRIIVLDLSAAEGVDARGLGTLVFLHNWARAAGIHMKLVNPSKLVLEMLELTGLTSVLHISSVDDIIQIFCDSDRAIKNADRAVA
jgi:anti-anti-sigma factor